MKAKELHDMDSEVLLEQSRTLRDEIFKLRFQHATGELENTARLGEARRDYARSLTIARQLGIDIEKELSHVNE